MTRTTEAERWAMLARWSVAVALYLGGCIMLPDHCSDVWPSLVFVVAVAVWLLKLKARREQEREIDAAELRAVTVSGLSLVRHFYLVIHRRRPLSPAASVFLRFLESHPVAAGMP